MAQLAIKGHAKRGSEVIALLEMLGGKNIHNLTGTKEIWYILSSNTIEHSAYLFEEKAFTLDEFLEKFPYKIGDRVKTIYGKIGIVSKPIWSNRDNCIRYELEADTDSFYFINELQPYKEEIMEERESSVVVNIEHKLLKVHSLRFDKTQLMINDEYELRQEGDTYYIVRKKPQYPKTYIECANILDIKYIEGYKNELFEKFQELLIARDAYWKIAGEQMGLDKPWKPDWESYKDNFCIITYKNKPIRYEIQYRNRILAFPTEEMRDTFYENFKDLIENCKELL